MSMHPQQDVVALSRFREKVAMARRQAGHLQKELAAALGVDAETLSRKLHGRHQSILTLYDVKEIIKTLAGWLAITTQQEAFDLLGLLHLSAQIFSPEEWESVPLSRLEPATRFTTVATTRD